MSGRRTLVAQVLGLVGDVGGTNARFAIASIAGGRLRLSRVKVYPARDFPTGDAAVRAYLAAMADDRALPGAVIAAAGPVRNGAVSFTNHRAWRFSEVGLTAAGGFSTATLINDFTAQALAIDQLKPSDCRSIGPRFRRRPKGSVVILGPGTGFGVGGRIDDGRSHAILTGEGGHVSFAPEDATEIEILKRLAERFGRVSVERILSGPGLVNLYQALADIEGLSGGFASPDRITEAARVGDRLSRLALGRFCAILGAVAGDFALTCGATGGVYIAGGIAPAIMDVLQASEFRARFEAKGRFADYLCSVPTQVVVNPQAALLGAAKCLADILADKEFAA